MGGAGLPEGGASRLHTTAWSVVRGAQAGGEDGRHCLERLMYAYWKPAYYYARRRGMSHHDAADCVQEFFARMLAGDWLATVDQERGRFRGWLLTALRRWVQRSRTATGAGRIVLVDAAVVACYAAEADGRPEDLFHRSWARTCLEQALALLESEHGVGARGRQVAVLRATLQGAADGRAPAYEELAERFAVPVTTITNDLHRGRALFRGYLLRVVRDTVSDPGEAEAELSELRRWLTPG
jgi:RNA polymerase sigma-70 factor (ECF subfamily)